MRTAPRESRIGSPLPTLLLFCSMAAIGILGACSQSTEPEANPEPERETLFLSEPLRMLASRHHGGVSPSGSRGVFPVSKPGPSSENVTAGIEPASSEPSSTPSTAPCHETSTCISSWTTMPPTRHPRSSVGWLGIPGSTCTSRPPARPGSTSSNVGSSNSPTNRFVAAAIAARANSRRPSFATLKERI